MALSPFIPEELRGFSIPIDSRCGVLPLRAVVALHRSSLAVLCFPFIGSGNPLAAICRRLRVVAHHEVVAEGNRCALADSETFEVIDVARDLYVRKVGAFSDNSEVDG